MKDLLGREMTDEEVALLDAYEQVKALRQLDLSPAAAAGVDEAAAALWVVVNDLALTDERPE